MTKAYHGGAFFDSIGTSFSSLENADTIINADVLDAWFPPSPKVIEKLQKYTEFIVKTSPPTHADGLIKTIATTRGISAENILVHGGSSNIIFSFFTRLLTGESKVVILDPMYGEYSHIFEHVIQCQLFRYNLHKEDNFILTTDSLRHYIAQVNPDVVVLVNPNSPTGTHCQKDDILRLISFFPGIQFIVDETYIEYVGSDLSMERNACEFVNLNIIKSMSKVYALSGVRVAYMVAHKQMIDNLLPFIPPWAVSLSGQIAAVEALQDEEYYRGKYQETHALRKRFAAKLSAIPEFKVYDSVANFILVELLNPIIKAKNIVEYLRTHNIFIRNCDSMSSQFDDNFIRIAVKDQASNDIMLKVLQDYVYSLTR